MPPRPGAPPSRPAGGRGGRLSPPAWSPLDGAAGRRPMPWVEENGLLPGRGAPGRAPLGRGADGRGVWALAAGASGAAAGGVCGAGAGSGAFLGPGLGPGFGPGAGVGAGVAAGAAGSLDGSSRSAGAFGSAGEGASTAAAAGASVAGAASGSAGLAAAFLAGAFLAAFFSPAAFSSSPNLSVNRLTTGGSTVDDADLTNSPISPSLARTTLLSTPNSLASSWTRTLATLLLLVRAQLLGPLAGVHAHREVLIECS